MRMVLQMAGPADAFKWCEVQDCYCLAEKGCHVPTFERAGASFKRSPVMAYVRLCLQHRAHVAVWAQRHAGSRGVSVHSGLPPSGGM